MENDQPFITLYRQLAEQSLNWGESSLWSDEDFEQLSDRIFEKTQARLSVSTLKRIWGKVRYESSPSTATLNVLARFLDYSNWREFQQKHTITAPPPEAPVAGETVTAPRRTGGKMIRRVVSLAVIPVIGLAIVFLLIKAKSPRNSDPVPGTFQFESRVISDDVPNSVVFNYDASFTGSDSIYIQQSWDPGRRELVPRTGKQHTSIYYYPGYYTAKLIVDGAVKKEDAVFIKTKGWKGIIDKSPVPVYLHPAEMKQPSAIGISAVTLAAKTGSPVFNDTWVAFCNVRSFDSLMGSDFTMEAALRNTATVESAICRQVKIFILGKESAIIIPLSDPGCIASLNLLTGSRWVLGKENDLSAFGCDFKQLQTVKCKVSDQALTISLNGKEIFTSQQQASIGEIIGLRFAFEGTGEIHSVKLAGPHKTVYEETF